MTKKEMEKMFRSRSKAEEKEDDKLYESLKGDISEIRGRLKMMYMADKLGSEDYIHGMVVRLDRIEHSLFSYLFDGDSAKSTMEYQYPGEKGGHHEKGRQLTQEFWEDVEKIKRLG